MLDTRWIKPLHRTLKIQRKWTKNICSSKILRNMVYFGSMQLFLYQRTLLAHLRTRCVCLTRDSAWTNNCIVLSLPPSENSEKLSSYISDSYFSHFQEINYLGVSKNVTELNCRVKAWWAQPAQLDRGCDSYRYSN